MEKIESKVEQILKNTNRSAWPVFKFGDVAFNISERIKPSDTNADIYVGLEHLDSDSIHIRRKGKPSDVKGTKLRVYKGDIIFGKRRAYQRKAAIADFNGICSAHAMVLRVNPEVIDPMLFPFFIHSDVFMNKAVDISEGSLSPTIKWKILAEQKFHLPSRLIQKKLAEILWAVDELIEKSIYCLNCAEIFKKVAIRNIFLNNINPLKKETIDLPKGYIIYRLGDVIKENEKSRIKVNEVDSMGNYPFFTSGEKILRSSGCIVKGENIFLATGGMASVKYYKGDASYSTDTFSISGDKVSTRYLYYYLIDQIDFIANYLFMGTGLKHLQKRQLRNLYVPVPKDLHRENNIVEKLEAIKNTIIYLNDYIESCRLLIKCLLNKFL